MRLLPIALVTFGQSPEIINLANQQHSRITHPNELSDIACNMVISLIHLGLSGVSDNQLTTLSSQIDNLRKLKWLYLYNNLLEVLPDNLNLPKLATLSVDNNKIKEIPKNIWALENLTELFIENNLITEIPEMQTHLTELYIFNNPLERIHQSIWNTTNIHASHNQLKVFPDRCDIPNTDCHIFLSTP